MTNSKNNKKGGISILGILLLAVALIIVLSYFHISIQTVVQSPDAQNNFNYVGSTSRNLWTDYLAKPVSNILNSTIIKNLWDSFISNMQRIHDGKPTDFQLSAPQVPLPNQN